MAIVASVRRNLCGCTFGMFSRLPISRSRCSIPPICIRSCGARNVTKSAGLSSVRLSRYSCRCSLALASKYTILSLSPLPNTTHSRSAKSISSRFSRTISPTRIPVDASISIIAKSRSSSQLSRIFSKSSSE